MSCRLCCPAETDLICFVLTVVDLTPLYPVSIKPQWMLDLRMWYITTYKDRFFVEPPTYFTVFMLLEAVYHLPLSIWAVGAILRGESPPWPHF
jgi:EXPERA (EXPanded EBP superfamily)